MFLATVGILAATVGNVWVACNQWTIMGGQLAAMKTANEAAKTAADAAAVQADAAVEQAASARGALDEAQKNNLEAGEAAKQSAAIAARFAASSETFAAAAQKSAGAAVSANAIAQKNADAALQAARLEQRAWVGPVEITLPTFVVGEIQRVTVFLVNTGRTPALNVFVDVDVRHEMTGDKLNPTYTAPDKSGRGVLYPGTRYGVTRELLVLDQARRDAITQGLVTLYIYGRFRYEDIFSRRHDGMFCAFVSKDLKQAISCDAYNSASSP